MDKKKSFFGEVAERAADGLWYHNPTLVLLLGMCPALATSTSVQSALGMGLSATVVMILTNTVISLLRRHIPSQIRIAVYIVIAAAFVTSIDLLLQAYLPSISKNLGIFIPLIVVNCIIFARAEAFASKNPPLSAAIDALFMGLGFTLALFVVSAVREVLGNGTFFGIDISFGVYQPMVMLVMPAGGFLVLGCIIAVMQKLRSLGGRRSGI